MRFTRKRESWHTPNHVMTLKRHTVYLNSGNVRVAPTFKIIYQSQDEDNGCVIWKPENNNSNFILTLFKSPSGSGKTTLLGRLYARLSGREAVQDLTFDFRPDYENQETASVAVIPQNPPMVNHWKLNELLPESPKFLEVFFPTDNKNGFWKKRLGEFSGGQRRKLYTLSALERLATQGRDHSFILLDETFDGLGSAEAKRCLVAIKTQWNQIVQKPLYVLLVTHLNDAEVLDSTISATKMGLQVQESSSETSLTVKMLNTPC